MTEKLVVESSGSVHLMTNGERVSVNFVSEPGTPYATMILVTDIPPPEEEPIPDICKYRDVKIKVEVEYGGRQYRAEMTGTNVLTLKK